MKRMGINKTTPVLMCHGDRDQVVNYQWGKSSGEFYKSKGINVEFKTYKNMAHSSCQQELIDISQFIKNVVP